MGKYRLTINRAGRKAGEVVDLDASDALVKGGFAVPVSGARKAAPAAPAPEPVAVEEAPAEESSDDAEAEKSSGRGRRSSSDDK